MTVYVVLNLCTNETYCYQLQEAIAKQYVFNTLKEAQSVCDANFKAKIWGQWKVQRYTMTKWGVTKQGENNETSS